MPASMPNLNSIHTMGAQFKNNVFASASKHAYAGAAKLKGSIPKATTASVPHPKGMQTPAELPTTPQGDLTSSSVSEGRARRRAGKPNNPLPGMSGAAPVHARSGAFTEGPVSHAAPGGPDMSVNSRAPGTGKHRAATAPVSLVQPQQMSHRSSAPTNMTTSSAQGSGKHRANPTPNPVTPTPTIAPRIGHIIPGAGKVSIPSMERSAPSTIIPQSGDGHVQSQQFSNSKGTGGGGESGPDRVDVSTKDNSPYPTHVHPANSSDMNMHDLSRKISTPGKPNPVTVGSRNIKGGGIASMGSQLEAGLRAKPLSLPDKRKRV